jgi:hypothetical protein
MPITSEAYKIIYEGKNARNAVVDLMTRDRKHEIETVALKDKSIKISFVMLNTLYEPSNNTMLKPK